MAVRTFVLSYNATGGGGAPGSQSWQGDASSHVFTISSTEPSRAGHIFRGWALSSSASDPSYYPGGSISVTSQTTLYAVWRVITYTITYRPGTDGSGTVATDTKTYNVPLTLKGAIFSRTGYTQTGWAASDGGAQAYALSASYTANASITLYPVWTATKSTVSTTNGTLGTAQTITITRYNTSFTHTLTFKYGNATGTIATSVGASYSWTPPTSLADQFPAATSGVCTITCTTYSGSDNIGSSTTTCTLSIPSSVKCTVGTVTVAEAVAGLASKFGAFVQGKSKATISATINSGSGSPAYGATVSAYSITTNGQTLTSNGATTGILNTSGSNSYSFKITDTRGYSDTKSSTYNVLAYSSPTISASISRNASDASKIDISYSYSISSCNSRNDKSLSIKYRVVGGNYTTIPITISSYTDSNITYQITGLDANTAYEVAVVVTDYFTSATTTTQINPTGNRVFDISDDDKTIARHGANYSDGWDHQYFNEQFHGVLDVTQRRASASLSSAGWYRVMKIAGGSGSGAWSFSVDFDITRAYNSTKNEVHSVKMLKTYDTNPSFVNEVSETIALNVGAIRYTIDGNGVGYVDIRYDANSANTVTVDFTVHTAPNQQPYFTAESLQWVATSPNGETELALYTFVSNTTVPSTAYAPTISFSDGTSISVSSVNARYKMEGRLLLLSGRFVIDSMSASSNTFLCLSFPTGITIPTNEPAPVGICTNSTKTWGIRCNGSYLYLADGGGNFSKPQLSTGNYQFNITAFV